MSSTASGNLKISTHTVGVGLISSLAYKIRHVFWMRARNSLVI